MTGPACSVLAENEPLAGTAPHALGWLVVEHPAAWGRDALRDSGIAPPIVAHVEAAERRAGLRFLAARRIGMDRRRSLDSSTRRVWLAWCAGRTPQTRTTTIDGLEQLLDWDLDGLTDGVFPSGTDQVTGNLEFICTHSKRDACCAVAGRERAASVPLDLHERVWECSHLGGHRFAATSVFLPSGRLYGRLGAFGAAQDVCEPAPTSLRGSSFLPAMLQSAECAVRVDARLSATVSLSITETSDPTVVDVTAPDGARWLVECEPSTFSSPASCGGAEKERITWQARIIERRS
jgi:hypothetical protein